MAKSKKKWLVPAVIVVIILILLLWFVGMYNGLIRIDKTVDEKWSQVENQYQRRADLIPNLVNTVKGIAAQEQTIFLEVTEKRSAWANAKSQADKMTAAKGLDGAIARLLLVAENYPQLRSNENYLALQEQLEGTENRIAVERKRYNEVVREFNIRIHRIPNVVVAKMMGMTEDKELFEAEEGAETVPEVEFPEPKGVES